ncbi:MAG: DUF1553 domain-containing protein [Planctomycetes bacterium]|nr:DUF1553 domain-containing protein [Planctomycetota bacterium]
MTPLLLLALAAPPDAPKIDFNRDVRPILADHCYQCHGPDVAKRKGKLRLDLDPATQKRDPVFVPGKPDDSELIHRVTGKGEFNQMPPEKFARPLSPKQIDTLKEWVKQGGKWEKHWALVPPMRPPVPVDRDPQASANPIDAFVAARLLKESLKRSPDADRATIIRRMTFDLTGLPPTPAEVDAFVMDAEPLAVERLADRLLASPRYGERMAWKWLEAARYADTNGYQTDAERDMWRWRDWVIEAYNRNLPFDQFTIEQLAGDMLPNATLDQRIATGFNRNHRGNSEGGIVPDEYAVEYVVDRVDTTATVWLGLTLGCARCHDHKFDPFSQREFYQLYAYFNNVPEKGRAVKFGNSPPYIKAPTRDQHKLLADLDAKLKDAEAAWVKLQPKVDEAQAAWERTAKAADVIDMLAVRNHHFRRDLSRLSTPPVFPGTAQYRAGRGQYEALVFDGKQYADAGDTARFGYDSRFSFALWIKPGKLSGAVLSKGPDEPQAEGYSVELIDGKVRVALTKRWLDDALRVETAAAVKRNEWQHLVITYDGSRAASGVKVYVNGEAQTTTILLDELNQDFANKEPLRLGTATGKDTRFEGQMSEFLAYARALTADEAALVAVPAGVSDIFKRRDTRSPAEAAKLRAYFIDVTAPADIRVQLNALRKLRDDRAKLWDSVPTVMVMEEMPKPRDAFVLLRGEYDKKGAKVLPAVPAALVSHQGADAPRSPANRLELAKWLVDRKNPLTARVAVNRMWQLHFGTGLVRTSEDFGTQGTYPTHPELLDWLAVEFARDWDVKRMHKLIVTSSTYLRSSHVTKELLERDPENKLFARGPRARLSAEMLRDQALFASGLLVEKQGGPSVKPYQPAGLWSELTGAGDYVQDRGANLYRRSLYTYWKRTVPPPTLGVFDTSTREFCWVRETRTNTPLHALTLLNDVTFVEAARVLAQRVMKEEKTPAKRLALAFKALTARDPTAEEAKVLLAAFERQLAAYQKNPDAALKLLRVGESRLPLVPKLDPAELAAYAQVCALVMNLDEAVTKE